MARHNRRRNGRPVKSESSRKVVRAKRTRKVHWLTWVNTALILGLYALEYRDYLGF